MAVRVITDSSACLPDEVADELDITVIDLHVMQNGEERSTSGLSSLELAAAYARQLERGGDQGVLALHLSKELSSTWSAAVTASAVFAEVRCASWTPAHSVWPWGQLPWLPPRWRRRELPGGVLRHRREYPQAF